ncbi:unnamed protein product [Dibothriocephalus latus]|uniref:Serine-threonine/tyrosine-protein kinase catalytic domain-containing protein n=1 Tax=Dibothriocephalus latus TaxID=60516 RepID=A0A3P7NRU6_DIBLA|nr:unnamed protein product [Dibothriocephalus latus]
MWEVFTVGGTPFEGMSFGDYINELRRGLIHPKPEFASSKIYDTVMVPCWKYKPEERPSFSDLRERLDGLLLEASVDSGDSITPLEDVTSFRP